MFLTVLYNAAINADRECLFGNALDEASNTQCGQPSVDEITVCQ
jgi:hypothetical protein